MRAPRGFELASPAEVHAYGALLRVTRGEERGLCKRLSPRALGDEGARADLLNEAAVLRALAGRGAPACLDAGEDEGGPYLVSEALPWKTLGALGAAPGMDPVAASAFAALAEVHEAADAQGPLAVLHADLSPENVLLSGDGAAAKLVDFGLAVWRERPRGASGAFRGTALYAAPEVARSEPFDLRADLFALAASLLHVASGRPPRDADTLPRMLLLAGEVPLGAWAERAARGFSTGWGAVLTRCVAFEAGARPESAAAVLRGT